MLYPEYGLGVWHCGTALLALGPWLRFLGLMVLAVAVAVVVAVMVEGMMGVHSGGNLEKRRPQHSFV